MNSEDMDLLVDEFMEEAFTKSIEILQPGDEGLTTGGKIIHLYQASFRVGVFAEMAQGI